MIANSSPVKAACLILSGALLVGAAQLTVTTPEVHMEGLGEAIEARIGSRFEDMAAGTLSAPRPSDSTPTAAPTEEINRSRPEEADHLAADVPPPQNSVAASKPLQTPAVSPTAKLVPKHPPPAVPASSPARAINVPPVAAVSTAPALQPNAQTEVLSGTMPERAVAVLTQRPRLRDPAKAASMAVTGPKQAKPKTSGIVRAGKAPRPQAGNAQRNNTQGVETGSRTANAQTTGTKQKRASQSGNAAADNYPGQVMRRISRVPRPRVNNRGTAVIAFSISPDGRLASASVARSSGSAKLDKAALLVVNQAAPFPLPPAGAKRRFSIRIKGG